MDDLFKIFREYSFKPSKSTPVSQGWHIAEIIFVNSHILFQMFSNISHPLLLFFVQLFTRNYHPNCLLNSFFRAQEWLCFLSSMLHHTDDINSILMVNDFVGLSQVFLLEVMCF